MQQRDTSVTYIPRIHQACQNKKYDRHSRGRAAAVLGATARCRCSTHEANTLLCNYHTLALQPQPSHMAFITVMGWLFAHNLQCMHGM